MLYSHFDLKNIFLLNSIAIKSILGVAMRKTGAISDVKGLSNKGYGMEEEAVKVIKKGPSWEPAVQNGRKVKAYRKQPITFIVTGN